MPVTIRSSPSGAPLVVAVPSDIPLGVGGEIFIPAETNAADGTRRVRAVQTSGNFDFNFYAPLMFNPLLFVATLIGYAPTAAPVGAGKNITVTSEYGGIGESNVTHAENDAQVITIPAAPEWFAIDLTPVLTSLAAGDIGGVNLAHAAVGGAVNYVGIQIAWS